MTTTNDVPADPLDCAHCGRPTTPKGQRPADGVRFCMAAGCRAAKQRHDHARRLAAETRTMEKRPCSCCGRRLKERPQRFEDLEYGRWCGRPKCQADKRESALRWASEQTYFNETLERRDCPACGRRDARLTLEHPRPDYRDGVCFELGMVPVFGLLATIAKKAWPHTPAPATMVPDPAKVSD